MKPEVQERGEKWKPGQVRGEGICVWGYTGLRMVSERCNCRKGWRGLRGGDGKARRNSKSSYRGLV